MAQNKTVVANRKALRDYHIDKKYEAGLQLHGNEVKSLREGKADLAGSFAKIEGTEVFLHGMHIGPYKYSQEEYDPLRPRKLLLHKSEIQHLILKLLQQGYTLVPLKIYFKHGYAKAELGLGKGKKFYDKRRALKDKQVKRETDRALRSGIK